MSAKALEENEWNNGAPDERTVRLEVNNGFDRVNVEISRNAGDTTHGKRARALAFTPKEATQFALELLNAATNVDRGVHGDSPRASKVSAGIAKDRIASHKGGA